MPTPSWVAGRLGQEGALSRFVYNTFLKRSSTYMMSVMFVATTVGIAFEYGADAVWNTANSGRQWKDIKGNYKSD